MGIKDKYSSVFRYLLITLNTFLAILCIAVIGFELWIRFDVNFETQTRENLLNINRNPIDYFNVKEQIRTAILVSFWTIAAFSIVTLATNLLGICTAMAQNRTSYIFYLAITAILVILEVGIGIFIMVFRSNIKCVVDSYINLSFRYGTNDASSVMQRYDCCGDAKGNFYTNYCPQSNSKLIRDCPSAVWETLNYHLMVTGFIMVGVVIVNIMAVVFSFILILNHPY